jgi:tRNA 2-thiouridine synthesizing protein A
MSDYSVSRTLDYKGLKCPMPIVKISQEMPKLKVGDVVEVLTTDPGSLSDFPAWAKSSGNEVLETKQETGLIRIFVRRKK